MAERAPSTPVVPIEQIKQDFRNNGMVLEFVADKGPAKGSPTYTALILGQEAYQAALDTANHRRHQLHAEYAQNDLDVGLRPTDFEPTDMLPWEDFVENPLTRSASTRDGALKAAYQAWKNFQE